MIRAADVLRLGAVVAALTAAIGPSTAQDGPMPLPVLKDLPPLAGFGNAQFDIVGIRFGESRDDVLAILKKNYPNARVDAPAFVYSVSDSRNNKVSFEYRHTVSIVADDRMPAERLTLRFTSPVTGSRVYQIERELTYSDHEPGDLPALRKAIIEKYGEPTLIERYDHQNRMEITHTWQKGPVQRLGEQDVQRRPFNAPRPDNVNPCVGRAGSSAYDTATSKRYSYFAPGTRKPYPDRAHCTGAMEFTIFYAKNPQTVRRVKVIATDYDRSLIDGQLLDQTLHDMVQKAANAVRGTGAAPRL